MTTDVQNSRLALRGIESRDDEAFQRMLPWTKMAFAVGGAQALVATTFGSADMLWQMVPVAAAAVILPHHPLEYVYNYGIRFVTKSVPIPANRAPVRFAFFMASVILAVAAAAFDSGIWWLGYALGLSVATVATTFVVTGFCVPAAIWAFLTGNGSGVSCALRAA